MVDAHDDYVWDHTGEHLDDSPLLDDHSQPDGSYFYNRQHSNPGHTDHNSQKLTKQQAEFILRTFEDGAALIRSQLLTEPIQNENTEVVQQPHCLQCRKASTFFERFSFIITLLLQIANILILSLLDYYLERRKTSPTIAEGEAVMIVIELLNLVLVVLTSIKLAQQMFRRRVNGYFLAQCYLSSLLLFAGLFALTYRLDRKSWRLVNEPEPDTCKPQYIIYLFLKMLYLSVSTATLCGTSVITPKEWYNYLLMGLQMILSFVAFASILGQMFSYGAIHDYYAKKPTMPSRQRRVSVDSQVSRLTAGSYGALDSTQPINAPTSTDLNVHS